MLRTYIDGSFIAALKIFGWSCVIVDDNDKVVRVEYGYSDELKYAQSWNVAGELMASMKAVDYAISKGEDAIQIYYDYTGIEYWATGVWKNRKQRPIVTEYIAFMQDRSRKIKIYFNKVIAHTGVANNELADKLCRGAIQNRVCGFKDFD